MSKPISHFSLFLISLIWGGCASSKPLELTTARALQAVADQMQQAIEEYHQDISLLDSQRETLAIQAFIQRMNAKQASADEHETSELSNALQLALTAIRTDREVALKRYFTSLDNVKTLEEISGGLNEMGLAKLKLNQNTQQLFEQILNPKDQ